MIRTKKDTLNGQLSRRLQAVMSLVPPTKTVADVGCDHGYVAISLVEQGKAERVIAMDINRGPLLRAQEHIAAYGMEGAVETRLSDGVAALAEKEADCLICAGMGGKLVTGILERGFAVVSQMKELILQPQSDLSYVREWLADHDFCIVQEEMVLEEGKFYPMMRVKPRMPQRACVQEAEKRDKRQGDMKDSALAKGAENEADAAVLRRIEYRYGPCLLREANPVLNAYLDKEKETCRAILDSLNQVKEPSESSGRRRREIEEKLADIEFAKKCFF